MRSLVFAFIAYGSLVGCTHSDGASSGSTPKTVCETKLESCAAVQKGCAVAADGGESCQACAAGQYVDKTGHCLKIGGTALAHSFPDQTVPSGGEVLGLCRSWTVGNATELYVNAVEIAQNESSHHSNWTFVPEDQFAGPDGVWKCKDRNYDQISAAVLGGVLYAQSTQAVHEVQKFPDGVVVKIPAHARIISDIHLLNTTSASISGKMTLTLYTLAAADVKVKLTPFHLDYQGLDIPPQATSRFTANCDVDASYQKMTKAPLDMQIYYLLPHTHALGSRMFVDVAGGPNDGKTLLDVTGTIGEARGRAFDPPVAMTGAKGFKYGCEFINPRTASIHWGFGDQEMCEALGFAASPLAFETNVDASTADGSDGTTKKFTGTCSTLAFNWNK